MPTSLRSASTPAQTKPPAAGVVSTDGELLMRFTLSGDEPALAELLERHAGMVWGVCRNVLRHEHDAEDAFQATFVILLRRAASIRACDSVAGWLYRVAVRTALAARGSRAKRREERLSEEPSVPETAFPDLHRRRTTGVLMEELSSLPDKYQTPLVMRYLEGQTRRAIAERTETTIATVQGRLARGKRLLRRRLARRGVSLAVAMGVVTRANPAGATPPTAVLTPGGMLAQPTVIAQQLATQGARTMLLAAYAKPLAGIAVLALGAALVVAAEKIEPAAQPAATPAVVLQAGPVAEDPQGASVTIAKPRFAGGEAGVSFVEISTGQEEAASDPREVAALEELVEATRALWKRVESLQKVGAQGGEQTPQAHSAYLQALAQLEQAKGAHEKAKEHLRSAVEAADARVQAAQESYDAGRTTLDVLLEAIRSRANAKLAQNRASRAGQAKRKSPTPQPLVQANPSDPQAEIQKLLREQYELESASWKLKAEALQSKAAVLADQFKSRAELNRISTTEKAERTAEMNLLKAEAILARSKSIELQRRLLELKRSQHSGYSAGSRVRSWGGWPAPNTLWRDPIPSGGAKFVQNSPPRRQAIGGQAPSTPGPAATQYPAQPYAALSTGRKGNYSVEPQFNLDPGPQPPQGGDRKLRPGDRVYLRYYDESDALGRTSAGFFPISDVGTIGVEGIGPIEIGGQTLSEAKKSIMLKLRTHMPKPVVQLRVTAPPAAQQSQPKLVYANQPALNTYGDPRPDSAYGDPQPDPQPYHQLLPQSPKPDSAYVDPQPDPQPTLDSGAKDVLATLPVLKATLKALEKSAGRYGQQVDQRQVEALRARIERLEGPKASGRPTADLRAEEVRLAEARQEIEKQRKVLQQQKEQLRQLAKAKGRVVENKIQNELRVERSESPLEASLGLGQIVSIKCYSDRDRKHQYFERRVRIDRINNPGCIKLPLIEPVAVAGEPISVAEEKLTHELARFFSEPHVIIKLLDDRSPITNPDEPLIVAPTAR